MWVKNYRYFLIAFVCGLVFWTTGCQPSPEPLVTASPISPPETVPPSQTPLPVLSITPIPTDHVTPTPISPTNTPFITVAVLEITSLDGNLLNQIARLETNMPRPGSEGFVKPGNQDMAAFDELTNEIETGLLEPATSLAATYGFELVEYTDRGDENAKSYLLREEKPVERGWGLFVFRTEPTNNLIIEAPHPLFDNGTPQLALLVYRTLSAQALLIAGAHRDANADGTADAAHNPQTVFQAVHENLIRSTNPTVLQIHGFATDKHPGYPQIVLGSDQANASNLLATLSTAFTQSGLTVGICDGGSWTALCGETNVQASSMSDGVFIHLELDETVRNNPQIFVEALRRVFSEENRP